MRGVFLVFGFLIWAGIAKAQAPAPEPIPAPAQPQMVERSVKAAAQPRKTAPSKATKASRTPATAPRKSTASRRTSAT